MNQNTGKFKTCYKERQITHKSLYKIQQVYQSAIGIRI